MAKERVPAVPKKSAHSAIRTVWKHALRESGAERLSLKEFARQNAAQDTEELGEKCKSWLFNKSSNFSKPPLGIGATRKKKGDNKGKKS